MVDCPFYLRSALLTGLFVAVLGPVHLLGQHRLSTEGPVIVNEAGEEVLLRGMGLGGWMLQEGYMLQTAGFANAQYEIRNKIEQLIGEEATAEFYAAWLQNHVTRADIDAMKSWGFNSVRLPMHYNLFTLPIEEEPVPGENTWLDTGFELSDSLISWCKQNEMYVVLDLHGAPGGQGYDAAISDYDPTKPSLWESVENRDKMAALWGRLAAHYVDEDWVAGYDLLNEPNWDLPGGTALRNLYMQCTDSIRAVDPDHIIFIEGNWWANDFSGLTPPWDDQLVYSPHKYWSINDVGSMQFATSLRDAHNVPLYLGESGENSNVWFRDAIHLLEDLNIGWAWWPLKKVASISAPLSIEKTDGYQTLLDYWSGNAAQPTPEFATEVLMDLAEKLKFEHCVKQLNVVDAMFRQVQSQESIPFDADQQVPGIIHATDFDMGVVGSAYGDIQVANYHVSTGNYTEWNSGWQYRNDGVDITFATDPVHSNGYKVSWLATDEWMKYTVDVQTGGLYDIRMRVSVGETPGMVHFETAGGDVSGYVEIPLSGIPGGWQTITVEDVYLEAGPVGLVFWADAGGFEVSHFDFSFTGTPASEVDFSLVNAKTQGPHHVAVTLNKPMQLPLLDAAGDFTLYADGAPLTLLSSQADPDENRVIVLEVEEGMDATMDLTLSYNGTTVVESGGNDLVAFVNEEVFNDLDFRFAIPGWIEAEAFSQQTGVELEATSDNGGGQNVGFLDEGDVMEYEVNVRYSGDYEVNIRTASESAGSLSMELVGENGQVTGLGMFSLPATGGWQTWATSSKDVVLDAGIYKLRVTVESAPFNLNWYEFEYKDEIVDEGGVTSFQTVLAYPNPVQSGEVTVAFSVFFPQNLTLSIYDAQGRPVFGETYYNVVSIQETLSLQGLAAGVYEVFVHREDGTVNTGRFLKPVR
ncbi:MAG: cellulase family glycosylhydrolase [Flavobacteriales bacterium]|nr:cellulase family glycosylhydrolase [Flavobacteriales bacterium]